MKEYRKELECFLKDKLYIVCLIVIALMAYGFSATNITVGIDDLECDRYIGSRNELLAAGRFGWLFWNKLFGFNNRYVENNFVYEVAGVVLLIWAAMNLCILMKNVTSDKISMTAYTIFSCSLISYPLMNEIWEYTGVNISICGAVVFVSFALLLTRSQLLNGFDIRKFLGCSVLLMIVCAGYESVAVVYVFLVFGLLFLQVIFETEKKETMSSLIRQGLFYAGPLAVGVILRTVVHRSLLFILHISPLKNGDTNIWWGKLPVKQVISDVLRGIIKEYFVKGIIYFPITELIVCVVVFLIIGIVLWKQKKNQAYWLPAIGMLISLVLLTLIQGRASHYRSCQVFAFFVAFVMMLTYTLLKNSKKRWIKAFSVAVVVFSSVICIHQASTMNYYSTMNYLRSEEEKRVICDIGNTLSKEYDFEKPVIFTGSFTLSEDLRQRVMIDKEDIRWLYFSKAYGLFSDKDIYNGEEYRKLPNTNVNSVIQWGMSAFGGQKGLEKLFRFYGFDYHAANYSIRNDAEEYVKQHGIQAYPEDGYIVEREDYIIVNMK